MNKKLKIFNGLKYTGKLPKFVVCSNCGLQRPLAIWKKEHGNNCKLPHLNTSKMS